MPLDFIKSKDKNREPRENYWSFSKSLVKLSVHVRDNNHSKADCCHYTPLSIGNLIQ